MKAYLELLEDIIENGEVHHNRTSQPTRRLWGRTISHDLSTGFPLLTTKTMAIKAAFVEMLGFIRGETDVNWYKNRGCNIWNADHARWHGDDLIRDRTRLKKISDICHTDQESIQEYNRLMESVAYRRDNPDSLGRIYGAQWRNLSGSGEDQLMNILRALQEGSNSRRLVMTAWAPQEFHMMALPPCHMSYHFSRNDDKLDIICDQRSCDAALGIPFNLANTALLCTIMAHLSGLQPGRMVWFGHDVHLYENQVDQARIQISRTPKELPMVTIGCDKDIDSIEFDDINIDGYYPAPRLKYELTVS